MERWSEGKSIPVMEATEVEGTVTQIEDNEVSGSKLSFAINLVLFDTH